MPTHYAVSPYVLGYVQYTPSTRFVTTFKLIQSAYLPSRNRYAHNPWLHKKLNYALPPRFRGKWTFPPSELQSPIGVSYHYHYALKLEKTRPYIS